MSMAPDLTFFAAVVFFFSFAGLKNTENRDSIVIGRQLKYVKGRPHVLKWTASEAFESTSTGKISLNQSQTGNQ